MEAVLESFLEECVSNRAGGAHRAEDGALGGPADGLRALPARFFPRKKPEMSPGKPRPRACNTWSENTWKNGGKAL